MIRLVMPHAILCCACGTCVRCRGRRRKSEQLGIRVNPDWRLWPEVYRYGFFRSIARDLYGPNANLKSSAQW